MKCFVLSLVTALFSQSYAATVPDYRFTDRPKIVLKGMGHLAATATIPAVRMVLEKFEQNHRPGPKFFITDIGKSWACNDLLRPIRLSTMAAAESAGLHYIDESSPAQKNFYQRIKPDVTYVQTPGSTHLSAILQSMYDSKLVLVEKPFLTTNEEFLKLKAVLARNPKARVFGVDHGRTGLILSAVQKQKAIQFLGGQLIHISAIWMEDRYNPLNEPHHPLALPHEVEIGRDEVFREGMSVDQVNHGAAMADLFADVSQAQPVAIKAARYNGSIGQRDTMSASKWEAPVRPEWGVGSLSVTIYVGRGIGQIKGMGLGPETMHGVLLTGINGNKIWYSIDDRQIYMISANGQIEKDQLDPRPAYVITMFNASTGQLGDLAFSVDSALAFHRLVESITSRVDERNLDGGLSLYEIGMPGQLPLEAILGMATPLLGPSADLDGGDLILPTGIERAASR